MRDQRALWLYPRSVGKGEMYLTNGVDLGGGRTQWTLRGGELAAVSDGEVFGLKGYSLTLSTSVGLALPVKVYAAHVSKERKGREILIELRDLPGTLPEFEGAEVTLPWSPTDWPHHRDTARAEELPPAKLISAPVRLDITLDAARKMALAGELEFEDPETDFDVSAYDYLLISNLGCFQGTDRDGNLVKEWPVRDGYGVESIVDEAKRLALLSPKDGQGKSSRVFLCDAEFLITGNFDENGDVWVRVGEFPQRPKTILQSARLRFSYQQYVSLFVSMALPIVKALRG